MWLQSRGSCLSLTERTHLHHSQSQLEGRLIEAVEGQKVSEEQVQLLTQQLTSATSAAGAEREDVCAMLHPPSGESAWLYIAPVVMSYTCMFYI